MSQTSKMFTDDYYFNFLRKSFQIDVEILDSEWQVLIKNFKLKTIPKNTVLLKPGDIETSARFFIEGVAKATYHGYDIYIDSFMSDNDFMCDTFSVFDEIPTLYTFETITDCIWIEVIDLKNFTDKNCKMQKVFLRSINRFLKTYMEYSKQIRKQTAKERYMQYCETHPKVVKYAKVSDIASYFGITVQSLSRIRNEIVTNGN